MSGRFVYCFIIALLIIVGSASSVAFAQTNEIEQLKADVEHTQDPRKKAKLLYELSIAFGDFDFNVSLQYANESYAIAKEMADPELLCMSQTALASYYYYTGDYARTKLYLHQAIDATDGLDFGEFPAFTYARLGTLYRSQGIYDSAMLYFRHAQRLFDEDKQSEKLATLYLNIGFAHEELSAFDSALLYFRKSLLIREKVADSLAIAEVWRFMAKTYQDKSNYDSVNFYIEKIYGFAKRHESREMIAFYHLLRGDYLKEKGRLVEATKSYEIALDEMTRANSKRYQAQVLRSIGEVYSSLGNYTKGLEHMLTSLKLDEELQARHQIARTYAAIGWMYVRQKNFDLAKEYASKALISMDAIGDEVGMAYTRNLLGMIEQHLDHYDQALLYFDSAYVTRMKFGLEMYAASTLQNKSYVYEERGDLSQALRAQLQALNVFDKLNVVDRIVTTSLNIGELNVKLKNFPLAETYFQRGLQAAVQTGNGIGRQNAYLQLAQLYRTTDRFARASEFYDRYVDLTDSLTILQNVQKVAELNALYQLEQKEKQINDLSAENQLTHDKLKLQESELDRKNNLIIFSIVSAVLLAAFSLLLLKYYTDKAKANKKLLTLNAEINEQKEEILAQSEELTEANQAISSINQDLEVKVDERTSQLKQAYVELDTFFYRSSHDFRRPLTTLMGLAEVAKVTVQDKGALTLFENVNITAASLDRMLGKLRSVSDMGSQQLVRKEVQLETLVWEIVEDHRAMIDKRGINVKTSFESTTFESYPALVRIILENLVENSIHFSDISKPFIHISSKAGSNSIQLIIEDNGAGIHPEHHERIFDMYYRASLNSRGNGLGLYIVKKAIDKLGGAITFHSAPDKGSTFIVELSLN